MIEILHLVLICADQAHNLQITHDKNSHTVIHYIYLQYGGGGSDLFILNLTLISKMT